jgi:uncharacterized protein YdeI (YjbR/CyaY-like superfamily)
MTSGDLPVLTFADSASWEAWLEAHGSSSPGLWMKLAKSGATSPTLTKAEAIEGALCHGWIDGQLGKLDAEHFLVRFTPRRPRSRWSAVNRDTAQRLIRARRMRQAGLQAIEAAKADGRWDAAYAPQSRAEAPPDLLEALAMNAAAEALFVRLDRANRYAILYRVQDATRPETRARRIAQFVDMLARGETIHPRKGG